MNRCEHPKPQFFREDWINLNGTWKFAFDFSMSGFDKNWQNTPEAMTQDINIPFCPESQLSGVGYKDFINAIWYTKKLDIPTNWENDRVFIHFGAVDYECHVFVNGSFVGKHIGGGVSFSYDITKYLKDSDNTLIVYAKDFQKAGLQPAGKQSERYNSHDCSYTRTTGIWQTVWLERRSNAYIDSVKIIPDFDNKNFIFTPVFKNIKQGDMFVIKVSDKENTYTSKTYAASGVPVCVNVPNAISWCPDNPYLYDITYELVSGGVVDTVKSYAGMRKIHVEGNKFFLNNEEIFLRFVLDQGFYPEGVWTAPSDEALKNDILLSLKAGFNGARLHQKVFEERFLYHADTLGYLVWAEYYDWGVCWEDWNCLNAIKQEWIEELYRDVNHPSIIAWTPFNETVGGVQHKNRLNHDRIVSEVVDITRKFDPTRPVNDTSGYIHVDTDIYSIHDYAQDHKEFAKHYEDLSIDNKKSYEPNGWAVYDLVGYNGTPFVVDEYGGTWWAPNAEEVGWGYGNIPKTIEEVYERIRTLTKVLVDNPNISGFCYTQLTDVEQEKNGIYAYDRTEKFDMTRISSYFKQK